MRIESISIKNLRCIKDDVLYLDPYTCLVGPNGAGKSTFLHALNIFFRHAADSPTDVNSLSSEDFHLQDTTSPIEITITFNNLSAEALADFKDYERQGKLVVSAKAVFDPNTGRAQVKHFGKRLGMKVFEQFFRAFGDRSPASELTTIFEQIESEFPELAAKKVKKKPKENMYDALREFESQRPGSCELLDSEDLFYGVSKGFDKFDKYVQWIFIPAVKDATEEVTETKNGALGKLLARTVRSKVNFSGSIDAIANAARQQYQQMLDANTTALEEVSEALRKRLVEWAHPDASVRVQWQQDPSKAVRVDQPVAGVLAGESGFEGNLVRLGHGFQRSYLLALLQELASGDDNTAPTLILGCEEPELYQHPPQERYLASIFEDLSTDNSQVIVSTHSPYFVSGRYFESVRLIKRPTAGAGARAYQFSFSELAKRFSEAVGKPLKKESAAMSKLHQALQPAMNEMFFTQRLVLVEGLEDAAYIHSWLVLTQQWEQYRSLGCHIVPTSGKSEMIRPAIIALALNIPVFAVFDADGDKIDKTEARTRHHRDNSALLRLFGGNEADIFPTDTVMAANYAAWPHDLATTVKNEIIAAIGADGFNEIENRANAQCGNAGDLTKNAIFIGNKLSMIHEAGISLPSLNRLCDAILLFSFPTTGQPIASDEVEAVVAAASKVEPLLVAEGSQ